MENFKKNRLAQRLLASFMSFVMVFSLIPFSSMSVMAAADTDAASEIALSGNSAGQDGESGGGNSVENTGDETDESAAGNSIENAGGNAEESGTDNTDGNADGSGTDNTDGNAEESTADDSKENEGEGVGEAASEGEQDGSEEDTSENEKDEGALNDASSESDENQGEGEGESQDGLEDISVKYASDLVYTGEEQNLVEAISGVDADIDTVSYRYTDIDDLESKEWTKAEVSVSESGEMSIKVMAIDAGEYSVELQIERINADDEVISRTLGPVTVKIDKVVQEIEFEEYSGEASTKIYNGLIPDSGAIYNFQARNKDENITDGGSISYSVNTSPQDENVAEIDADTGELTVYRPSTVTVKAVISGSKNYEAASVEHTLTVKQKGEIIYFENAEIEYILGTDVENISQEAKRKEQTSSVEITYFIDKTDVGVECDSETGKITISDYVKLSDAMEGNNEELSIIVTAILGKGISIEDSEEEGDEVSYEIKIKYENIPNPSDLYDVSGANGNGSWYISDVKVEPVDGYSISKTPNPGSFASSVEFSDEDMGENGICIYLKDDITNGISKRIDLSDKVKIDTVAPKSEDINIVYSSGKETNIGDKTYYFAAQEIKIQLTAKDSMSGIDGFKWEYVCLDDNYISADTDNGFEKAEQDSSNTDIYIAELTLPKTAKQQLKGYLKVWAVDNAGNASDVKEDAGAIIAIDSMAPEITAVEYSEKSNVKDGVYGFGKAVTVTVKLKEDNFFPNVRDVELFIEHDDEKLPNMSITWDESSENADVHTGTFDITEDGEYFVSMSYDDPSGNEMTYKLPKIIVDSKAPEIEFTYPDYKDKSKPQTFTIKIHEKNFYPEDIQIFETENEGSNIAKNIKGDTIEEKRLQSYLRDYKNWSLEGDDWYTASISAPDLVDAIYKFTLEYEDMGMHSVKRNAEFFIDNKEPEQLSVDYHETSPVRTILSNITLGIIYKPSVEVVFTAHDMTSGVNYFKWSLSKETDKDSIIGYGEKDMLQLDAVQDSIDESKFTASVILPLKVADQLRGNITYYAVDKCNNESRKETDNGNLIVVDTIAPVMTEVDYGIPDGEKENDGKDYFKKDITAKFTITEANFDSEDVEVELSKDNGEAVIIQLEWTEESSSDVHIGTYTIKAPDDHSGDGDYVFSVSYVDKSGNAMDEYTSETLVIDTMNPLREVDYNEPVQTVDGVNYFDDNITAAISITEKNFYPEDVNISISKDGEDYPVPGSWHDNNDDNHTRVVTLSEEGNYIIAVQYEDPAGNRMEDYGSQVLVIDKTDPVIEFDYADYKAETLPQSAIVTITEKNFRPSDIEVITIAKNIKGEDVASKDLQAYLRDCEWSADGDVHTALIPSGQLLDAIYNVTFKYKDLALHTAERSCEFTVDHVAPDAADPPVEYSEPIMKITESSGTVAGAIDAFLSVITFGFYNPSVIVTFTAYDMVAGVDYFTYSFKKQDGVNTNSVAVYEDVDIPAVQDSSDKSKFTASVKLPRNEADQLRGNVVFSATDKCENESSKITDAGNVIIVDTIAPKLKVEYTLPVRTLEDKLYYNKALTLTFTVTETNFYSEDIVVELSKNKAKAVRIEPSWTDRSTDVHVGTYTINAPASHAADGDYVFTVSYTDRSQNEMTSYKSDIFVIDTMIPVIEVSYANQNVISTATAADGGTIEYFDSVQTATVSINEHNFNPADVEFEIEAADHAGGSLDADSLNSQSSWSANGDINSMTITYPGDANYTFTLQYTDLADNKAAEYEKDYFTVDTEMPTDLAISYSASVFETVLSNITFGFYNAKAAVTIEATDNISGVESFKYSYLNAEGVSSVNAQLMEQEIEEAGITYSNNGMSASATFEIPASELGRDNQFNGTVNFNATDRAGNESEYLEDVQRLVVDNMAPTITVEYNNPVQTMDGIAYYDADVTVTVTINEANFYSEDVEVSVSRDGADYQVSPSWSDNSTDAHVGSFSLTGDGDYFVNISYADKSGNEMETYESEQLTIDTDIAEAVITVNGEDADGKAFKGDVVPEVRFEDKNLADYEITLTRTSYAAKNVDVTDKFIEGHMSVNSTSGQGTFDTFDKTPDNDGIYTLEVSITDKSGHSIDKSAVFTVNRFGSVYVYSDYLVSLIAGGGSYVHEVEEDLVITEYNADRLVSESLDIEISRDGRPLELADYNVTPEINATVQTGESGWYQYRYTINRNNFDIDGLYKIAVSSADETGNTPENSNYEDKLISFWVDSTVPEISSISGLEKQIVNATSLDIKYTVYDTIGLKSVRVYVSGSEVEEITEFTEDINNYSGSFTLYENSAAQEVRLVAEDIAGNITDTAAKGFESAYVFNSLVTVSTNMFVRWYADKMLFWGSIGGCFAALLGTGFIILVYMRRKKKAKEKVQ